MQAAESTSDNGQKSRFSLHNDRPYIVACFSANCENPLLCVKCFGTHLKDYADHEDAFVDIETIREDKNWTNQYEVSRQQLITTELDLCQEKELLIKKCSDLITSNIDYVISSLQKKKKSLIDDLTAVINSDQEQEQFKNLLYLLNTDRELLQDLSFGDANPFMKVSFVKNFLDKLKPNSEDLIKSTRDQLEKHKLEEFRVAAYKDGLIELIESIDVSQFLAATPIGILLSSPLFKSGALDAKLKYFKAASEELEKENQKISALKNGLEMSKIKVYLLEQNTTALNQQIKSLEVKIACLKGFIDKSSCRTVTTDENTIHFCVGTNHSCKNSAAKVWGSGPYTSDSGLCAASLHSEVIGPNGGFVVIQKSSGLVRYEGSEHNGVNTMNYGYFGESIDILPFINGTS